MASRRKTDDTPADDEKQHGNSKYHPRLIPVVSQLCARGMIDVEIAEILGIAEQTLYKWKKAHPDFALAMTRSKELVNEQVENAIIKRALGFQNGEDYFPPDVAAGKFWLQHRMPEVYRERSEHNVNVNINEGFLKLLEDVEKRGKVERVQLIDRSGAVDADTVDA